MYSSPTLSDRQREKRPTPAQRQVLPVLTDSLSRTRPAALWDYAPVIEKHATPAPEIADPAGMTARPLAVPGELT